MKKIFLLSSIAFIACSLILSGCNTDEEPEAQTAPELPPQSSFVMDFNDFSNPDDTLSPRQLATYQHWGRAFAHVTIWNTLITVGLAIPVASFYEAFNHQAVYHPDQQNWTWSYDFMANGQNFGAELTGSFFNDTLLWAMRISKENGFSNFVWYQGASAFDRSGGYWVLNESPQQPNEILQIDWTYEGQGIGDIRYTNVNQNSPDYEGYINYGTLGGDIDRFYDILSTNHDNLVNIQWSSEQYFGRIKDPWKFGDEDWHCWDGTLQDTDCP